MTNTITILALSTVLLSVTFIPLAEGAVGWNGFLQEIGFGGSQIYEISGVSIIPELTTIGSEVELRCLDGDLFLNFFPFVTLSIDDPSVDITNLNIDAIPNPIFSEQDPAISFDLRIIGYKVTTKQDGAMQLFAIPVTVTGICVNPSPLASAVGGEWQGTDTVALFIGYSVLNAYWLAPILAGLGAGIYLTKTKWKR